MDLTPKQEKFVQGLVMGLTQSEAYKKSYNCKNMKDATISNNAYKLMQNNDISTRYKELLGEYKEEAKWTRGKAEEKLIWLLDKSVKDIEEKGIKQANGNLALNSIKELNTLTDLYPKDKVDNKEDKLDKYFDMLEGAISELK